MGLPKTNFPNCEKIPKSQCQVTFMLFQLRGALITVPYNKIRRPQPKGPCLYSKMLQLLINLGAVRTYKNLL